jgi:hypothetical protein
MAPDRASIADWHRRSDRTAAGVVAGAWVGREVELEVEGKVAGVAVAAASGRG